MVRIIIRPGRPAKNSSPLRIGIVPAFAVALLAAGAMSSRSTQPSNPLPVLPTVKALELQYENVIHLPTIVTPKAKPKIYKRLSVASLRNPVRSYQPIELPEAPPAPQLEISTDPLMAKLATELAGIPDQNIRLGSEATIPTASLAQVVVPSSVEVVGSVSVTFSMQPLEAFKSAFLTKLSGVWMYDALACNHSGMQIELSQGLLLEAARKHVSTVNYALVTAVATRARDKSKKAKVAKIVGWLGKGCGFVTASGIVAASPEIAGGCLILGEVADLAAANFDQTGINPATLLPSFLDPSKDIKIAARACAPSSLFLGSYNKNIATFTETIN